MKLRILLFCAVVLFGFVGPLWVFLPLLAFYIAYYISAEVLLVTLCIDAYFGYGETYSFLYTAGAGALLLLVHILRPTLSLYNR